MIRSLLNKTNMVHIHTRQRRGLAVTLGPQTPYVLLRLLHKSQGLTALLRLQRIFYIYKIVLVV